MVYEEEMGTNITKEKDKDDDEVKWVKHYSSNHHILLVGEGDFSFSSSLAQSFGSAFNIVATSLDSYDDVVKKYKKAKSNVENLMKFGASTLHGVDTTKMKFHSDLKMQKFDRIIFNFPHAGFHGMEDNVRVIEKHKKLVLGFFRNASGMLRAFGEIHVSHKTSTPFCDWNIEELAWRNSLALVECVDFKIEDYPGYNNKRGDGTRCDKPFPLGACSTFKFRYSPAIKKLFEVSGRSNLACKRSELYQSVPVQAHYQPTSFRHVHPQTEFSRNMDDLLRHRIPPLAFNARNANIFDKQLNLASEIYRRPVISDGDYFANRGRDHEIFMTQASGRFQHFQRNPFKLKHQQDAFSHTDYRKEFNKYKYELPGNVTQPLRISIRRGSGSAPSRDVDYECYMADASGRYQKFPGHPFGMHDQPNSQSSTERQTELYRNMNEHPGFARTALNVSIIREEANPWHMYMTKASERSQKFQDHSFNMYCTRYMAEASGRLQDHQIVNCSHVGRGPGETWSERVG